MQVVWVGTSGRKRERREQVSRQGRWAEKVAKASSTRGLRRPLLSIPKSSSKRKWYPPSGSR